MKLIFFIFSISLLLFQSNVIAGPPTDSFFDSLENKISTKNDSILSILNSQIDLAKINSDSLTIAKTCYLIGKYYIVRTYNYPLSYNYLFRALNNFKIFSDTRGVAKCEMQIGLIYYLLRNFDEAQSNFESAYNKMLEVHDTVRTRRLAYLLGLCYSEKKENIKAKYYLNIAAYNAKSDNDRGKREYAYGMGKYYLNFKNGDSALYYLLPLLERAELLNDTPNAQLYSAEIAQSWELKNDINKTEFYANRVVTAGRNINTGPAFMNSYYLLYKIAIKRNDPKKAVEYYEKYIHLKDSIINEKNLFNFASLKTNLTLEKERQDRVIHEAEQQSIIEQQKTLKIIFILSGIFLLIFVIILQKKNRQLAESFEKLKSTQKQLINQEKLASMGKISAGIAHEMLNPLNFVKGFSKSINDLLEETEVVKSEEERALIVTDAKKMLSKITDHAHRMETNVKQVINHVRLNPGIHELSDVNKLCDNYLKMVVSSLSIRQNEIKYKLIKNYGTFLPLISVNQQEIGRVIMNIVSNSFLALEDKFQLQEFTPEIRINTLLAGDTIKISISDNGIGIKKEILNDIFNHFYSTRLPGKGVGLGLSVANDIIKSYGGKIIVSSEPMVLTTFIVELPVT